MKIQLVSFPLYEGNLSLREENQRIEDIVSIINSSNADFIMFSEHILCRKESLETVCKEVQSSSVTALFELKDMTRKGLARNRLFLLQKGCLIDLQSRQVFADSSQVDDEHCERLVEELEYSRQFEIAGKRFIIIQCGENNVLKSVRGEGKAVFRLNQRMDLKKRFEEVLRLTDVVLNPTHTHWVGHFREPFISRLLTFSEKKRYCFTCAQLGGKQLMNARMNPADNSTMKGVHSRRKISPIYTNENEEYLVQTFEI